MVTQEKLKEQLHYDPETGIFSRLVSGRGTSVGDIAGFKHPNGYIQIQINKQSYKAHRLAWLYMTGTWPSKHMDHVNHIRHDNRWDNLRSVTQQTNNKNKSKSKNNTSGVIGVQWHKLANKWIARIHVNGQNIYLGCFVDKNKAIKVRQNAEIEYGYHSNHGELPNNQKVLKIG